MEGDSGTGVEVVVGSDGWFAENGVGVIANVEFVSEGGGVTDGGGDG